MKKNQLVMILLLLCSGFFAKFVNAEEIYYQNENGVSLTNKEYDFFTNMYWNGYQEYLTINDYNDLKDMGIFEKKIEKEEILVEQPLTRSASVTSNLRRLTISKACSNDCAVSLVTTWLGSPFIKSYDVVGARVFNSTITSIKSALVSGSNYGKTYSNPQSFNNGFGYSILVPNVSDLKTTLTFVTSKGGTAYGSYQHATSNTTELVSKLYTIGAGEYGNVFRFTGAARTVYDNAPGVDVSLN